MTEQLDPAMFEKAACLIEERGLYKASGRGGDTRQGAVCIALAFEALHAGTEYDRAVGRYLGLPDQHSSIFDWNDSHTLEEVAAALRGCGETCRLDTPLGIG